MAKKQLPPDTLLNPMPVVMACCQLPGQKPNLITLAWAGIASSKPATISVAIRPSRYSFEIINQTREFVIVVPNEGMIEAVDYCGCVSGRDVDKFKETGLTPEPAVHVAPPLVVQAPINLECKVSRILDLGAHHLFLGEVVCVHVDEAVMSEGKKIDVDLSSPVVYSYAAHEYRALGKPLGTHGFARKK